MPPNPERNLILSLVAQNENQALAGASEGFSASLTSMGYSQLVLDMCAPDSGQKLMSLLKTGQVAFAYGFAGVGAQFSLADGTNLWTAARIPFAALWHDHPCYNYRQHIVDSPFVVHCYHVRDHIEARQKFLPPSSSRSVLLSVSGAVYHQSCLPPWSSRERKILFAKTASRPEILAEDWKRHPLQLQNILWALVESAKHNRNLDLTDAAHGLFKAEGLSTENLDVFMGAIQEVDSYIRAWRSDRLARALLPHPAHIIGRGWEYLKEQPRKAEFFPAVSAHDYSKQAMNYRILANSSPLWRYGIHERVYLGIFMGAISLTDRTLYSDYVFNGLPNYVGFEWQDNLDDAVTMALRRADDDADYIPEADRVITERTAEGRKDYLSQLIEEVENTRLDR